ncbi:rRNA-processing protein las1 [Coemansia biformis]|uniref:rRNA-processing protein las1 n=1 Tax=Coemansia biformis TaxID=1286918 RepID=A0A9W8D0S5_9FUNG|nr:rRNA-processing protein las1 [Coemansia biformis]
MAAALRAPKIVPWASTAEYMCVADQLYSADLGERKRGVATVKAWRGRGRVPAAVDATANLVEMTLADQERPAGVTVSRLRHMYAMALIRFVNSIVDLEQKGVYAQSMATLASRIGMPAWFVELRHACTHEQIPSLAVLRSACDQAHGWLGNYYWRRQARALPADTMDRVRTAVSEYVSLRAARMAQAAAPATAAVAVAVAGKSKPAGRTFDAARRALKQLVGQLHPDAVRLHVVPVLLEPGLLVPEDRKLRAKFPSCKLPPGLVTRWEGALRLFAETWGKAPFFEELLSGIVAALTPDAGQHGIFEAGDNGPSASHAATLAAWVRWILESHYVGAEPSAVSIDGLLEGCLRNPCYYSRAVLKIVSEVDPALRRALRPFVDYMGKALAALVAADAEAKAAAGQPKKGGVCVSEEALQQEEALMRRRLEEVLGADSKSMDVDADDDADADGHVPGSDRPLDAPRAAPSTRWAYAEQPSWSPCPIGALSDGSIPPLEWPAWLDDVPLHTVPA